MYNILTYFIHRILRIPVRLRVAYDNKVKHPDLAVVFLHGISANSDTWRTTFRLLANDPELNSVRVIALDLLGFGKSLHADWLKYNYAEYDHALELALRRLHLKCPVVLVGHSMGSLIAADYATNYTYSPDLAGLILVSPPVLMAEELAKLPDRVYTKSYSSLHKIATTIPAAEVIARIAQRFTSFRSSYIKTTAFANSMENVILNHHNYQTFTKIRLPSLIVHGHFDPLVVRSNLKRAAKQNPRYLRYASVIGQHDISAGKRAKIIAELKEYLHHAKQAKTI